MSLKSQFQDQLLPRQSPNNRDIYRTLPAVLNPKEFYIQEVNVPTPSKFSLEEKAKYTKVTTTTANGNSSSCCNNDKDRSPKLTSDTGSTNRQLSTGTAATKEIAFTPHRSRYANTALYPSASTSHCLDHRKKLLKTHDFVDYPQISLHRKEQRPFQPGSLPTEIDRTSRVLGRLQRFQQPL